MSPEDEGRKSAAGPRRVPTTRLVGAAQKGDRRALEELFSRYLPRVRQIVALRMGRRQRQILEVDDIAQEALLRVFQGLERFERRSEGSFRNWLARLVESEVAGAARKANAKKRGGGKVRLFSDLAPEGLRSTIFPGRGRTPSEIAEEKEMERRIEDALLALPRHHREVIILRRLCELPYEEVARELGFAEATTARKAHSRAMQKLRDLLKE